MACGQVTYSVTSLAQVEEFRSHHVAVAVSAGNGQNFNSGLYSRLKGSRLSPQGKIDVGVNWTQ
jgi:hypothetical protein